MTRPFDVRRVSRPRHIAGQKARAVAGELSAIPARQWVFSRATLARMWQWFQEMYAFSLIPLVMASGVLLGWFATHTQWWPWVAFAPAVLIFVPCCVVWARPYVSSRRPKSPFFRALASASRAAIWPIGIVVLATLTEFVRESLESDHRRDNFTSTINSAVTIGIIAAGCSGAVQTFIRVRQVSSGEIEVAERLLQNLLPGPSLGSGAPTKLSRVGDGFAHVIVQVSTRAGGIFAVWIFAMVAALQAWALWSPFDALF